MPMLYPTGWVGGKNFHQGLLNGVNRNKVILHSPKGTLMASFAVKKNLSRNFYDMWIKNFEVKIKHFWTVMMVGSEASTYFNAADREHVRSETISVEYRETEDQVTHMFTKILAAPQLLKLRLLLTGHENIGQI